MDNMSLIGMMNSIVPITRFNKGEANKIFEEVENSGMKIVMKNNRPACVLLSPMQYDNLLEMLSDSIMYAEAEKRMAANDDSETISHKALLEELGITEADLADVDVDIE
ncbi:MAG: type II toxin-antitoxin system Phd/YefM family antitoxin [Clostridia bacterium]|nr:type II toxin-antitoxin system Phd/YefM family antitoxin [Clostridia bacterium]